MAEEKIPRLLAFRDLRAGAAAAMFIFLAFSGVVTADELNGSNYIYGANDYVYIYSQDQSNEHAIGQKLKVVDHGFDVAKAHHIAPLMSRTSSTTSGNVCLEFGQPGSVLQSECRPVTDVPTSPGWLDFYFTPLVSVTPGGIYEYYVYYTGTCTTCVRGYYATTNEYLPGEGNNAVRLSKTSPTQAYIHPGQDSTFLFFIAHSPITVTDSATNIDHDSATLRGRNTDDADYYTTIYFEWGTTSSYGSTTDSVHCPESTTVACTRNISGLQSSTTYHYRICGNNGIGTQCGSNRMFTTDPAPNNPPTSMSPVSPSDGATGVSTGTSVSWAGGDDPDGVTYDVFIRPDGGSDRLACDGTGAKSCPSAELNLQPGTTYNWYVIARDGPGATTRGPSGSNYWSFTTSGCDASKVVLWQAANQSGGCRSIDADDGDFLGDTFDNGASLNDAVSSIQVPSGQTAILYEHSAFRGQLHIVAASDPNLDNDGFNDRASSLRIVPCAGDAPVVLFYDHNYEGGCLALHGDDSDFTDNVFSNGAGVNDAISSIWVRDGYQATLFQHNNYGGIAHTTLGNDKSLVGEGFNDHASSIRIELPSQAPANDLHARPAILGEVYAYHAEQSTVGATTQGGEQTACNSATLGASVWYKFTAVTSGTARITTWGSDFDTVLAAYAGTGLGSTQVDCNDDSAGTTQSELNFQCVAGQEYRIQVGGYNGASGNLVFHMTGCMDFRDDPFVATPRQPFCVSSDNEPRFEVVYAYANDAPDLYDQRVGRIREMIQEANGFLHQDASTRDGRTVDYRIGCTGGVIDVLKVAVDIPSNGDLLGALRNHPSGFNGPNAKYLVWFEKNRECGFGYAETDHAGSPSPGDLRMFSPGNPYATARSWAVVECDDSSHGVAVMMHEAGHAMGAVHDDAPDSDGAGHCTDNRSMLCDNDNPNTGGFACADLHYDCGFDSYFDPNPVPDEWLFDNWNQGHPYNGFLQFNAGPGNDAFDARTTVSAPYSQSLSTQFATHEQGEPQPSCAKLSNTVWYRFTPDASGTATVSTSGSNFNTVVAAYTGSGIGSLSQVACDDDGGSGTTSSTSFPVTAGISYAIQVGGFENALGVLQVQVSCSPHDCNTVNQAPDQPSLSCTPDPSQAGQTVTCTFKSMDADSSGVYYTVNWGDGSSTRVPSSGTVTPNTDRSADHSYSLAGTYTVSVTATDNGVPAQTSAAATHTQDVQLVVNQAPGAPSLSCSPDPSLTGQMVSCSFSSMDTDSTGVYYVVDWGDGSATARVPSSGTAIPGTSRSASHTYSTAGGYTISVYATDNGSPAESSAATTEAQTVNQAPVPMPYSIGFDTGSATDWTLSGLWHPTTCVKNSPSYSLGYNKAGCPTDFNTGSRTMGDAVTPPIVLGSGSTPHLTWNSWHETETGGAYDKKIVSVSTNDGATWTQVWQETGTQSTWNARDVDLSAYAGQTIRVRFQFDSIDSAINTGDGWYVDDVSVANPSFTVPDPPRNVAAAAGPGVGQIRVTWDAPSSDGGSAITGYKVYVSTSSGGPFSLEATVGSSTYSYTDSNLGNGATRYYQLSAVNAAGEGTRSNTASATTWTTPSAPRQLVAEAGSALGEVDISWMQPSSTGGTTLSYYRLYRATDSSGPFTHIASPSGTSYTDSGRTLATAYYYRAIAVNVVGAGPVSNTDCSMPYPEPPLGAC